MLLFKNKVIDDVDALVEMPVVEEKKVASTIPEGEYRIPVKIHDKESKKYLVADIYEELKKYCKLKGISDYVDIVYTVSSVKPDFMRNDDYFIIDRGLFKKKWYLPNINNKVQTDKEVENHIYLELETDRCLIHAHGKKYISNMYAENKLEEAELKTVFKQSEMFNELKGLLRKQIVPHFLHFPQYYGYNKPIKFIVKDGKEDIDAKEKKVMTQIIDEYTEKFLQEAQDFWIDRLFKKPLVKFWLESEYGKKGAVELELVTKNAIAKYNHDGMQYKNGILIITDISRDELNNFYNKFKISYKDMQTIEEKVFSQPFKDEYVIRLYKYYKKTIEQQDSINEMLEILAAKQLISLVHAYWSLMIFSGNEI